MNEKINDTIFQDTLEMIQNHPILIDSIINSKKQQKLYPFDYPIDIGKKRYEKTETFVVNKRSFEAASGCEGKVAVLNFANFYAPCAHYFWGNSQEECLCRTSTLIDCLFFDESSDDGFYARHKDIDDPVFNSDILYTSNVTVFKTDTTHPQLMGESDWYNVDVITCAAPNSYNNPLSNEMTYSIFRERFDRIFRTAIDNQADTLILGAFGCGVFRNNPFIVAQTARHVASEYDGHLREVVFALPFEDTAFMKGLFANE